MTFSTKIAAIVLASGLAATAGSIPAYAQMIGSVELDIEGNDFVMRDNSRIEGIQQNSGGVNEQIVAQAAISPLAIGRVEVNLERNRFEMMDNAEIIARQANSGGANRQCVAQLAVC